MTRERFTDEAFDQLMSTWLDERAHGPAAEPVLDAALSRTRQARPLPGWLLRERWIPMPLKTRVRLVPRLAPTLLILGLLLALAVAIALVGSQRRVPPPFGLAAPGSVAFVADGDIWTANPDGSKRVQLTSDQRIDGFPTFSRDGTRIAFRRINAENSRPDWQDWGDVMVAAADGGNPIVLEATFTARARSVGRPTADTSCTPGPSTAWTRSSSPRPMARCGARSRPTSRTTGPRPCRLMAQPSPL